MWCLGEGEGKSLLRLRRFATVIRELDGFYVLIWDPQRYQRAFQLYGRYARTNREGLQRQTYEKVLCESSFAFLKQGINVNRNVHSPGRITSRI